MNKSKATESQTDSLNQFTQTAKDKSFRAMNIREEHRVMDFGCGLGKDLNQLSDLVGIAGEAWGIDNDPIMIKNAILNNSKSNVRYLKSNTIKLNFPKNYFDSVRAENVFSHLSSPAEILNELTRVLKNDGMMVFLETDWNEFKINSDFPEIEHELKVASANYYSSKNSKQPKLKDLLKKCSLEEVSSEQLPFYSNDLDTFHQLFYTNFSKVNDELHLVPKYDFQIFTRNLYEKFKKGDFLIESKQTLIKARKPALVYNALI